MSRKSAEVIWDDEEMDIFDFMLSALGLDFCFTDVHFGKDLIQKEIVDEHMDVLLKMVKNRATRSSYFAIGYMILTTGAKMDPTLRKKILKISQFSYEERIWRDEDFAKKRKICLRDFYSKVKLYKENHQFFPISLKYPSNELGNAILSTQDLNKFIDEINPKNILHINLDGWDLDEFPEQIAIFKNLRTLSIEHNNMEKIPENLGELNKLEQIYLNDNDLTIFPNSLLKLKKLEELSISNNPISRLPKNLSSLKNLKHLNVRGTKIEEIPSTIDYQRWDPLNKTIYF